MFIKTKKIFTSFFCTLFVISSCTCLFAAFNYGEALQKSIFFYDLQRLGKISAGTGEMKNRVYWRGDSFLQDYVLPNQQGVIDLGGGFADAGDNVKFNFPMAAATTMLAWGAIEFRDAYVQSQQLSPLLANLRWATDYLLRCWDPANKRLYGQVSPVSVQAEHSNLWMPFEVIDQASIDKNLPRFAFYVDAAHPGTDLAAETVAALAASSIAFKATDAAYAGTLLNAAIAIYDVMVNVPSKGKYSDNLGRMTNGGWQKADVSAFYNSWSGYNDEIAWASTWLYRITGEDKYLSVAKQFIEFNHTVATQSWDDKSYGTYLLLAKFLPDSDVMKATAKASAQGWLDSWAQGINGHVFSRDGLAIATALAPWGNARYAASTAFTALIYDTYFNTTTYHAFAKKQIDYMLGLNSKQFSYVEGFGSKYPTHSHHATAQGRWNGNNDVSLPENNRHIAYGALVGGPKDINDTYEDNRNDYIGNEVALDYNAGLVGALAKLYAENGGSPLPADQFPPTRASENPPPDEFFVNGAVQSGSTSGDRSTVQVSLLATNHSAWPARVSKNLKLKYFINLADKPANGEVKVNVFSTDSRAVVSPLTLYDAEKKIYYVEVWFRNIPIYPGGDERVISSKETQLQFQFNWPHDYTKDWSYQGLVPNVYKVSANVPIYEMVNNEEKKLFGMEPTNIPKDLLTLVFAANLPAPCQNKTDILHIANAGEPTFTIGSPFTYSLPVGGPYNVTLRSTNTPILVEGGTCKGILDVAQITIPGTVKASYTFTPAPPVDKGTIRISRDATSDSKCNDAVDTLYIDQNPNGFPFSVLNGVDQSVQVGLHEIKLASQMGIPAGNGVNGTCKSTLAQTKVDVIKNEIANVTAKYVYTDNNTNQLCKIASAKVTSQSDWGPAGIVNTFEVQLNLQNFPPGKINLDAVFTMKNDFVQSFWGNFTIFASSFNMNHAQFTGETWNLNPIISGFINNKKVPLHVGDNPLTSITVNGLVCQ